MQGCTCSSTGLDRHCGAFGAFAGCGLSDLLSIRVIQRYSRETSEVACLRARVGEDERGVPLTSSRLRFSESSLELVSRAVGARHRGT